MTTCFHCHKEGATKAVTPVSYHGTESYRLINSEPRHFHPSCYEVWWKEITWHLDTLDERMNANEYFKRMNGLEGVFIDADGKEYPAHASWTGLEAKSKGIPYRFKNRRPHPDSCKGCSLYQP